MAKPKTSNITEWHVSIDRGRVKEEFKTESGEVLSLSRSFLDFVFNRGIPQHYNHALVEGSFVGKEEGEIELECAEVHEPFVPKDQMYGTEGGIVRTRPLHYGEPIDELEAIIPLQEGGIVSKLMADLLSRIHAPEEPIIPLPHNEGMEQRKCFNCQKEIGYWEYILRNYEEMSEEVLENIWKSPYVQLYCCSCFRKKNKEPNSFDKLVKKRERLLNKAYRINEKFGFLVD
ncbi:hypothetical protein LCGC14_2641340 [marine sediment metagenome]|uniref:Uncharacterized protein n=1 Tax=marine sediment metagenome TaxID=412755 RepID=A0A0F9CPN6_9ZZZZ